MANKKHTIGVTGSAGFIGSHLCEKLVALGYNVVGIDNMSKGLLKNLEVIRKSPNFNFYKVDVTNHKKVSKLFKKAKIIVHLAAAKIPRYGDRLATLLTNTEGTKSLLEAAKNSGAKIIFASTSDVYGKNPSLPFKETADLVLGSSEVARWAYAVSKIFDEQLCFAYQEAYNVPFIIIRFFGVYGPKQHRSWYGGPQSLFIDAIIKNQSVEIHGTGKQSRTFLYIDDAIDAIVKSIESKRADGKIVNIGSKKEITINSLANLISTLLKKPIKVKKVNYQEFTGAIYEDVSRKIPSLKKAEDLLGWKPKMSLKAGLSKTIKWYKDNPL